MTPAWIVYAWPRVLCDALLAPKLRFAHLSTLVMTAPGRDKPATGQTLWQRQGGTVRAGVAWDWIRLPEGVVALVDPMALISNLQFLNREGEVLAPLETTLQLNRIVHGLPWQHEVQRVLAARAPLYRATALRIERAT